MDVEIAADSAKPDVVWSCGLLQSGGGPPVSTVTVDLYSFTCHQTQPYLPSRLSCTALPPTGLYSVLLPTEGRPG